MTKSIFILLAITFSLWACKESPKVDPILQEALSIQDDAIHIGISLDSLADAGISSSMDSTQLTFWKNVKAQIQDWRSSMIAIPGVEHDHHHDHGDHEHHHHDHGNSGTMVEHLSATEMKAVQEEWKAAIVQLQSSLTPQ